MTLPAERHFTLFPRGTIRDNIVLAIIRNGLRQLANPETGQLFTEEEVRVATQFGSREWILAEAIDILGATAQARAAYLADQVRPDHANTRFLREIWMPQWGLTPLLAEGGRGPCTVTGTPGTSIVGSQTIPDPSAHTVKDSAGVVYQVTQNASIPGSGTTDSVQFKAITGGVSTNPVAGTVLTWDNRPAGADETCTVFETFVGGVPAETDAEAIDRLLDRIRNKQAAGNWAQFRAWARGATAAVQTAFVYPCALRAGSTIVAVLKKRAGVLGPTARIPDSATLAAVQTFITPPSSPVVPERVHVLAVAPVSEPTNMILRLGMRRGDVGGWSDLRPWPGYASAVAQVGTVTSQVDFQVHSDTALPGGASSLTFPNTPRIMAWNPVQSRYEELHVQTITDLGSDNYRVQLSVAPAMTIVAGTTWISPDSGRRDALGLGIEAYFDSLGPGELVNLATDERADRAFRNPEPTDEFPGRAGQSIVAFIEEQVQAEAGSAELVSSTVTTPSLPGDPADGPSQITAGRIAVYDQV